MGEQEEEGFVTHIPKPDTFCPCPLPIPSTAPIFTTPAKLTIIKIKPDFT